MLAKTHISNILTTIKKDCGISYRKVKVETSMPKWSGNHIIEAGLIF